MTDENLEYRIIRKLSELRLTLTTAESCTGGMVASRIVNISGASSVYGTGFITYSNQAKQKHLGVRKPTLAKYGAVSAQVAEQMAKGACKHGESDAGLAITGIAGPDGGSEEKPVGLVYIACSVCGRTEVRKYLFQGNRTEIRESAATAALSLLLECILVFENR